MLYQIISYHIIYTAFFLNHLFVFEDIWPILIITMICCCLFPRVLLALLVRWRWAVAACSEPPGFNDRFGVTWQHRETPAGHYKMTISIGKIWDNDDQMMNTITVIFLEIVGVPHFRTVPPMSSADQAFHDFMVRCYTGCALCTPWGKELHTSSQFTIS